MHVEVTSITPAQARGILRNNTHNRPLRTKYVDVLARDMAEGRWAVNGETIKISLTGAIIDGQHRLEAAVAAGYTLTDVVLVTGLPQEAQATVDIGRGRTSADNLGLNGHKNAAVLAAVARKAWQWDQGNIRFHNSLTPTHTEIAEFVDANPLLHRSSEIASSTRNTFKAVRQAVTGTAHYILMGISPSDAAEFFAQLAHGAKLEEGHPVLSLRTRFMNDSAMRKANPFAQDVALLFRAWNGLREGRDMLRIQHGPNDPMVLPV